MTRFFSIIFLVCAVFTDMYARTDRNTEVLVAPSAGSWEACAGDSVYFTISVLESNIPATGVINYEISYDLMAPHATGVATLSDGKTTIGPFAMAEPGYLRCTAKHGTYSGMGTIGFSASEIKPVTENPDDFDQFWADALSEARRSDLKPLLEYLSDRSTPDIAVYRASWQVGNGRFYGMLAIPRRGEPMPAVVQYPGAGVYRIDPNMELARKGAITLTFNPHGIAPDLDADIYADLALGALRDYPTINIDDRDRYYYRRMVQGAVVAIDFLRQLNECDGRVATYGGSQGGFLSIAASALHPDVVFTEARFPALSDMAGYTQGRAGGWPHYLKAESHQDPEAIKALSYYDTANFALRLKAPVAYAYGYNDLTCAPTTTRAVYNVISAPKTLNTAPLMGHATTVEQNSAQIAELLQALGL